jgi:hypothetical protein
MSLLSEEHYLSRNPISRITEFLEYKTKGLEGKRLHKQASLFGKEVRIFSSKNITIKACLVNFFFCFLNLYLNVLKNCSKKQYLSNSENQKFV